MIAACPHPAPPATAAAGTALPPWRPLLVGEAAERAREAVAAIAAALPPPAEPGSVPAGGDPLAGRPAARQSELALFFAYLAAARGAPGDRARALAHLDAALDALARVPHPPWLHGGFAGVAWTARHLDRRHLTAPLPAAEATAADTGEIDEALAGMLDEEAPAESYDLIAGLAGLALYALEGLPDATAAAALERIVGRLAAAAEVQDPGAAWFTPPAALPPHQREGTPAGCFNLGMGHGAAGAIAALAGLLAAGVAPGRTDALLEAAVAWLLAQEQPAQAGSAFANWTGPGIAPHASRLAWCYGDLGIAAALLGAARASGRGDWEAAARRVARRAAARPAARCGVEDAGLCHGAAGAGHLFHRLYRATGDEEMGEAARRWLGEALARRVPGRGIGGYLAWHPTFGGWREDVSLLTGAAGVGLSLLAAVAPVAPEWDRLLGCAVAPLPAAREEVR